jgi:putative ABC transport system permease protein
VEAVERRLFLAATANGLDKKPAVELYLLERGDLSRPFVVEGTVFDPSDADGVWLGKHFADAHGLRPGDKVELTVQGMRFEKTVRALVHSAEHVYLHGGETLTPDFAAFGYAFLSAEAFPFPQEMVYSTLLIRTDGTPQGGLANAVGDALEGAYDVFLEQKDQPSVVMFQNEIQQHKMMGDIFPVVFLLIALLTILTTMTRIVRAQRIQVGTLCAMGFRRGTILGHYVSYGFFSALTGAAAGLLAGPLSLPYLFYPSMSGFYTLPEWHPAFAPAFALVALAIVLLCVVVSLLACGRLLRESPADTLKPKAPKAFRHSALERTRLWGRLGFNPQWNIRDAARNRARSLMAVVGVLGCTALFVCALGMNDSMEDLKSWQYGTVNRYESKLILDEAATPEQVAAALRGVDGEALMEVSVEVRVDEADGTDRINGTVGEGSVKKSGMLTVRDHTTLICPTDERRQPVRLPEDGVSISRKFAQELGVGAGDRIEWRVYGTRQWTQSEVAAVYRDPANQGITMERAHFESLGGTYKATSILSAEAVPEGGTGEDGAGKDGAGKEGYGGYDGVSAVQSMAADMAGWDDLTEAMFIMVYLLIAAAAVLSIVVLYNLGLLSFTEMEREIATLKVLGMKTGLLRRLLLTQNLWFSAIGFVLGVPSGLWLTGYIISFSGESFDFPLSLHAGTLALSFCFTFALSILVNRLFSRKIRCLDMVASLKAME